MEFKNWNKICEEKDQRIRELEGKFVEIVERLEEELDDCRNWSDIEEDYYMGMYQGFRYAIEIVKGGGVNERD